MKVEANNGGIAIGKIGDSDEPIGKFKKDNYYEITVVKSTLEKVPGHAILQKREKITESFNIDIETLRKLKYAPEISLAGLDIKFREAENGETSEE